MALGVLLTDIRLINVFHPEYNECISNNQNIQLHEKFSLCWSVIRRVPTEALSSWRVNHRNVLKIMKVSDTTMESSLYSISCEQRPHHQSSMKMKRSHVSTSMGTCSLCLHTVGIQASAPGYNPPLLLGAICEVFNACFCLLRVSSEAEISTSHF